MTFSAPFKTQPVDHMKRVSLKDIAKIVGVSPSTISFVLNGKGAQMRISESLSAKIVSAAKKAGYIPNQVAVSLRTGQTKILGLVVEDISNNFFGTLAKIIEDEAERFGYRVVYCSTENDNRKGCELIRMLSQRQVDGYLITPTLGMEPDLMELVSQKKPVVLMDRYFADMDIPYVLVNNFSGVREGLKHFISKGYNRIGFVTVEINLNQMKQRENGYWKTLKENNIIPEKKLILRLKYNYQKEEAVNDICSFIKKNQGLQALFFATNYLGILGLESIKKLGLTIPDDLAMMCFDDHDIFRLFPPGISVIQQPVDEIAKTAVKLLMQQLGQVKNPSKSWQIELPPKFISRGSV